MDEQILKNQERAVFALRSLYRSYGYLPYKMSRFEEYDLYVRNRDFLVSDQIITFSGADGKLLALKPDVTLSIIKNAPEVPGQVQKVYYNENVYRAYREILQTGLECVGDLGSYEVAEVVLLAVKSLELMGGEYMLSLSHMGLTAAMLEALPEDAKGKAMTCIRQKNAHELRALCLEAGVDPGKLLALVTSDPERIGSVLTTDAEREAWEELTGLCRMLEQCGYGSRVRVDFSVGSDLKYYSGVVFKGYIAGIPNRVLSGGRYDRLLRRMGKHSGAIGFAIYLDLLEGRECADADVDTLILHDGTPTDLELTELARKAACEGSVLVARSVPSGRSWKRMIDLRKGEAL